MIRIILILTIIFILLTVLRTVVRKFRLRPPSRGSESNSNSKGSSTKNDIVDAKFEELK